jgi:hypothetical protein
MANLQQLIQNNPILSLAPIFSLMALFLFWNIALSIKLKNLKKNSREMFSGKKISNLEELLINQTKSIQVLDKDIQELYDISNQINSLASRGFHKFGMIRFNPFKDVGGDQSFSIAILNGKNNGITLSSLYTREGARIYAKSITAGKSDKHSLTEEEKKSIEIAIKAEAAN